VKTGDQLTRGERAADRMKSASATWTAPIAMGIFLGFWMILNSHLGGKATTSVRARGSWSICACWFWLVCDASCFWPPTGEESRSPPS